MIMFTCILSTELEVFLLHTQVDHRQQAQDKLCHYRKTFHCICLQESWYVLSFSLGHVLDMQIVPIEDLSLIKIETNTKHLSFLISELKAK